MVGQPDPLQVGDHAGAGEDVPEAGAGHRERLRERAHDRDVRLVGHQRQRALAAELDVGLVDDDQGIGGGGEVTHDVDRLGVAGRVVGRAHEHDVGRRADGVVDRGVVQLHRRREPERDEFGVGEPREAAVKRIRGLEDHGGLPGTPVPQQQLGKHLVRPVRRPRAFERMAVMGGEFLAQPGHLAVGVPVERQVVNDVGEFDREVFREWVRALVRVQTHGDVELR